MSLFLLTDPVSASMPSYVKEELQSINRMQKNIPKDVMQKKIQAIFARIPKRFQSKAEETLKERFPSVYEDITRRVPNRGFMSRVFDYFSGTAAPLPKTPSAYGFETTAIGSVEGVTLGRVTDDRLPTYKQAYALCLLAADPDSAKQMNLAMAQDSPIINTFKDLNIQHPVTAPCDRERLLGNFLFDEVKLCFVNPKGVSGEERVQSLYSLATFLQHFGKNFMSHSLLNTSQEQIKQAIKVQISACDEKHQAAMTTFSTTLNLDSIEPSKANRIMGRLNNLQALDALIVSLYARQYEEGPVALPRNFVSFAGDTTATTLTIADERATFNRLPAQWKEAIAESMTEKSIFRVKSHGTLGIAMRKVGRRRSSKADPSVAIVSTLFKEGNIQTFLEEKRGANRFLPSLLEKRAAVMKTIEDIKTPTAKDT